MEYKLPQYLTGDLLEKLNSEVEIEKPTEIVFRFSEFKDAKLFANSRLLSFLLRCREEKIQIIINASLHSKNFFAKYRNKRFFLDTTTGYILSTFADQIIDDKGFDFTELVFQSQLDELAKTTYEVEFNEEFIKYRKAKGTIQSGKESTAFFFDGFNRPKKSELFQHAEFPGRIKEFNNMFIEMLRKVGLRHRGDLYKAESISSNIGFEAVQNVNDHALLDLDKSRINGLQFAHFHRTDIKGLEAPSEYLLEDFETPISEYISLLRAKLKIDSHLVVEANLFEISITDSGIGIPGRMTGSKEIYKGDISEEQNSLKRSLQDAVTSKPLVVDDVAYGYGLPKIMETAKQINGIVVFRTGRLLMFKHFLKEKMLEEGLENEGQISSWDSKVRSYLPGTSISILFPIVREKSKQLSLDI